MRITFTLFFLACLITAKSQLLTWSPDFIHESSDPVTITVDATKGNQGLKDYTPTSDVYVHIGIITSFSTSSSDWKHVKYSSFNSPSPTVQTTYTGPNQWTFTINGGLRAFFGVTDPAETIQKFAVLFRNGPGTRVQRNTDGSDMYIPVYDAGLYVRLDQPF
ncbi:MAG: type sorting protein, partial [Segetibacter sp.]|nr:type sorting protein [Segetibacter sp.]